MLEQARTQGRQGSAVRMAEMNSAREGFASFRGYRTWFRVAGEGLSRPPLLCIHGGPGMAHDYLRPLEAMIATGREVVFYDQLGCGHSTRPEETPSWSLELFLEELAAVRDAAGLRYFHLLGHGWGGMLALEYALGHPSGLQSLILASAPASMRQWRAETGRLRSALPEQVQATLGAHESAGTTGSRAYLAALRVFLRRHLCRMDPWPDCLQRSIAASRQCPGSHDALFGRGEFEASGLLADWNITSRLGAIGCPTMVVSGRHDRTTPATAAVLYHGIPASEWVVFEHSANMPHLEEPERFLEVLDGFLARVEGGIVRGSGRYHRPEGTS
jgi:proline-specific peptidase